MAVGGFTSAGGGVEFEAKITPIVVISCIMAATGGLMFGYDIGVSGNPSSLHSHTQMFLPLQFLSLFPCFSPTQTSNLYLYHTLPFFLSLIGLIIRWCDVYGTILEEVFSDGVQKDGGRERFRQQLLQIRQSRIADFHVVSVSGWFDGNVLRFLHDS